METPRYTEDSYAAQFLSGKTIFPDDTRIFHRPGYQYDEAALLGRADFDGRRIALQVTHFSGAPSVLVVEGVAPGILRIRMGDSIPDDEAPSPMLLPLPEEGPAVTFEEFGDRYVFSLSGYRLELDHSPVCLRVIDPRGQVIFESETERMVGLFTAPPLGLRRAVDGQAGTGAAFLSWKMRNGEKFYGLGEKFTRFEKTGTRTVIWQEDTCGSNTTDLSYKAVPVLFSTAGWALLLHSSARSVWEVGAQSLASGALLVDEPALDFFLILSPSLKEQVMAYTALTGRPSLPPRWAFGVWMSRAAYKNRNEVMEVAARLRAESIPADVIHIDPAWMERGYYMDIGVEVCNFNWDRAAWGKPESFYRDLRAQGFRACMWINPYLSEDSPIYAEAKTRGYLVKTLGGSPSRLELGLAAGIVDFTNPAAKRWWQGNLIDLLQKGASTFKVDFGDRVPEDAVFFNGQTGRTMHNLYVHLYAEAVYEVVAEAGQGVVWRRPGYTGSQRFQGCWAGDTQVSWEGMAGALRGGLSAAFTGESCWSHDIGGFVGPHPDEELYIRWAQFGLLSPLARFHGVTPREPWHFGERALTIVRDYAHLRYSLIPYLLSCARDSHETGLPILRPLALEYPDEPRVDAIDDQYMLGSDLLIAPVIQPGRRARMVYLPRGEWWQFDGASGPLKGRGFSEVDAPLERIPLLTRAGAVIPRYTHPPQNLDGPAPTDWTLDIFPGDSHRHLVIDEPDYTVTIDYRCEGSAGRLEISPVPVRVSIHLIDRRPLFLRAARGTIEPGDTNTTFRVDASSGVSLEFRI